MKKILCRIARGAANIWALLTQVTMCIISAVSDVCAILLAFAKSHKPFAYLIAGLALI